MLKNSNRDSVTVRTVPVRDGQRVQEVDIVGCHGDRRVNITVADITEGTQSTAWVGIEDARILHAHLSRLIKRHDRHHHTNL